MLQLKYGGNVMVFGGSSNEVCKVIFCDSPVTDPNDVSLKDKGPEIKTKN